MPQHRGGAQGQLVPACQLIETGQHDALDRIRHGFDATLSGDQQQLFEEQWITLGALDALVHKLVLFSAEPRCQLHRLLGAQGPQIPGNGRVFTGARAPGDIDRIILEARGHQQQRETVKNVLAFQGVTLRVKSWSKVVTFNLMVFNVGPGRRERLKSPE